ncbi:RDD family protein [Streptomyces sp. ISL-98]|uniref:RDD family protein n=1 Tax=Streptomyces sp. ISL-98 TaxID=2819192 RepID=UPI001BEAAF90|nr:RDD family protein [Streptomyces sp. ISL-98]MBT2508151.1 RDD family protein [Streptomyces sp. ISL-98]
MSTDQPPPGQPSDDDPFLKKPPQEPPSGGAGGQGGAGGPGGPYGPGGPGGPGGPAGPGGGGPYDGGPYGGGPPYGTPPPPYSGGAADPLAGMPPLAPLGKRIVARIIDVLIVGVPLSLLGWLLGMFDAYNGDDWDEISTQMTGGEALAWQLITMAAYVAYDAYMTTKSGGQTVGKRLMNLRVAMLNSGMVPETSASLLRSVVLWVPALVCCFCLWWLINLVMVLVDKPYKQGLHDKAGKTVVVSTT